MSLLAAPNDADHRIQHVVHPHAPSGYVAERRIDLLPDVGESGACTRVRPRHAPIAESGKQHRHHGDQDGRDHVAAPTVTEHTKYRHWRDRLNDDNSVQNQVAQRE